MRYLIGQIIPEGKFNQSYGIIDAQLGDEVLAMGLDRTYAQEQLFGYLRIAVFLTDQPQHFKFTPGKDLIDLLVFNGHRITEVFVPVAYMNILTEKAAAALNSTNGGKQLVKGSVLKNITLDIVFGE